MGQIIIFSGIGLGGSQDPQDSPLATPMHVSSGNTVDWIWMPFWVVSGVGLGMGVLPFTGDHRRGSGSLGVNTMQKWRTDR